MDKEGDPRAQVFSIIAVFISFLGVCLKKRSDTIASGVRQGRKVGE